MAFSSVSESRHQAHSSTVEEFPKPGTEADLCIVMYGGGVTSYETARRAIETYGKENTEIWFADTRTEDRSLYQFNEEVERLLGLEIRTFSQGKNIWDIFYEQRALGNSRMDPCSKFLKRRPLRQALEERFNFSSCSKCGEFYSTKPPTIYSLNLLGKRQNAHICEACLTTDSSYRLQHEQYLAHQAQGNLGSHEVRTLVKRIGERIEPADGDGKRVRVALGMDDIEDCDRVLKARLYWRPFVPWFPLTEDPIFKERIMQNLIEQGIEIPRLYEMGFKHNNCGGFCVKAGRGQFAHLYRELPSRFLKHEMREQEFRDFIGADVSILTETKDGRKTPLTLRRLRERMDSGEDFPFKKSSACSCMNPIDSD